MISVDEMYGEYSYTKKVIMKAISENSRISVSELAKEAKCSRNTALSNLKALEEEFGLLYTLDFRKDLLGLTQNHVILAKLGKKPNLRRIHETFKDDERIQFVALTEGDFELLFIVFASSGEEYMKWETNISMKLAEYGPAIEPSQLVTWHIGFIPMLQDSLEKIDFGRFGLDDLDKRILLILNANSRANYSEISSALNISHDKARYRFEKIVEAGIVEKFTAVITKHYVDDARAFFVKYKFTEGMDSRMKKVREYIMQEEEKFMILNRFHIVAPVSGSYRTFILTSLEDFRDFKKTYEDIFKVDEPHILSARVEKVVKGNMPIRNLDFKKNYKIIHWE